MCPVRFFNVKFLFLIIINVGGNRQTLRQTQVELNKGNFLVVHHVDSQCLGLTSLNREGLKRELVVGRGYSRQHHKGT